MPAVLVFKRIQDWDQNHASPAIYMNKKSPVTALVNQNYAVLKTQYKLNCMDEKDSWQMLVSKSYLWYAEQFLNKITDILSYVIFIFQ